MTAAALEHPAVEHPRPVSLIALFLAFTVLALPGFGGVLAVVQREMVERKRWLTQDEFIKFPLFYVLLVLGSLGCLLAYRNLR